VSTRPVAALWPDPWLLPPYSFPVPGSGLHSKLRGLNDSKQLTEEERERYFSIITTHPEISCGIGVVDVETIDQINILQAAHRAMNLALDQLRPPAQHVLVDGRPVKSLKVPHTPIVKGDCKSYSIAAASVLAKVTRDRLMVELDRQHPGYGFADHKGYSTPQHLAAVRQLGPCAIHRRSFAPFQPQPMELFNDSPAAISAPPP